MYYLVFLEACVLCGYCLMVKHTPVPNSVWANCIMYKNCHHFHYHRHLSSSSNSSSSSSSSFSCYSFILFLLLPPPVHHSFFLFFFFFSSASSSSSISYFYNCLSSASFSSSFSLVLFLIISFLIPSFLSPCPLPYLFLFLHLPSIFSSSHCYSPHFLFLPPIFPCLILFSFLSQFCNITSPPSPPSPTLLLLLLLLLLLHLLIPIIIIIIGVISHEKWQTDKGDVSLNGTELNSHKNKFWMSGLAEAHQIATDLWDPSRFSLKLYFYKSSVAIRNKIKKKRLRKLGKPFDRF